MTRTIAKAIIVLAVLASVLLGATDRCASQEPPKPSELAVKIGELTKANKLDEAVALVRAKAAEPKPAAEVPLLMVNVGCLLGVQESDDESLALLKEVTERFPDSEAAIVAWCGIGRVYQKRGDYKKTIAALERGASDRRFLANAADNVDYTGTLDFACQALGNHYLDVSQWEKSLPIWLAWRPNTGCGNCQLAVESIRLSNILLCQSRSGRVDEARERAWRSLVAGGWVETELALFVLVRLYADARQLDDLRSLSDQLVELARGEYGDGNPNSENQILVKTIEPLKKRLAEAIELAESKRFSDHIGVFQQASNEGQVRATISTNRHVAAWVLIREHKRTVQTILKAARDKNDAGDQLTQVLAAVESPAAKSALGLLSRNAPPARRELIQGLRRENEARASLGKLEEPYRAESIRGPRLPVRFYEPWPAIEAGSLPTSLPADLFAEIKN